MNSKKSPKEWTNNKIDDYLAINLMKWKHCGSWWWHNNKNKAEIAHYSAIHIDQPRWNPCQNIEQAFQCQKVICNTDNWLPYCIALIGISPMKLNNGLYVKDRCYDIRDILEVTQANARDRCVSIVETLLETKNEQ